MDMDIVKAGNVGVGGGWGLGLRVGGVGDGGGR